MPPAALTPDQIAAAHAADLAAIRAKIDQYLAALDGLVMLDRHHRALHAHIKTARHTMLRARDLRGAKECAENLHKVYTLPRGHRISVRAQEWLSECEDRPFLPVQDLEGAIDLFTMPEK